MTSTLLVMLLSAAAADAPRPVVSVLYFENSTGDASLDVLRKGLADMMKTPDQLSPRTEVLLTYALCGFANFGSIGVQLGGIGGVAPDRQKDLARLGLRAMLGGTLACFMTACVAGVLL